MTVLIHVWWCARDLGFWRVMQTVGLMKWPRDVFERSFKVSGFSVQVRSQQMIVWEKMKWLFFLPDELWSRDDIFVSLFVNAVCCLLWWRDWDHLALTPKGARSCVTLSTWNKHIMLKLLTQKWEFWHYLFIWLFCCDTCDEFVSGFVDSQSLCSCPKSLCSLEKYKCLIYEQMIWFKSF